jgi:uncharacterized protein (TIGR03437 family)
VDRFSSEHTAQCLNYLRASVIDPVTLTIGGVKVPVFFAGPTPGFTGLYQVNATIPAGIAPSTQATLVLTQGGRTSATITVPVQ